MIDLYIIRHGKTDANLMKINGSQNDPLNVEGIKQSKLLFDSKLLPQEKFFSNI